MWDSVDSIWIPFNKPLEGYLDFMYLDVLNKVTTGMGNLVDPRNVAEALPWYDQNTGYYSSIDEIDAAWGKVKSRTDLSPHGGGAFKNVTSLRLTGDAIDGLIHSKLYEMESYLERRTPFRQFQTWPADAQLGLLSMAWGMGPAFNFPKFQGFASQRKWTEAATECRFNPDIGTIRVRNDRNQQLFRNAALVEELALDPSELLWPGRSRAERDKSDFVCGLDAQIGGEDGPTLREALDVYFECPVDPSGYLGTLGGPNQGGHQPPDWYIQYGMDLKSNPGAGVYAAFEGSVSVYHPHDPNADTPKVYGAQIFIRNPNLNNKKMGGFYTHITNVPDTISVGESVSRGQFLGTVIDRGVSTHLHHAVMEYVGGVPRGVDLYHFYLALQTTYSQYALPVRFMQDGSPPEVQWGRLQDEEAAAKEPFEEYQA